MTGLRIAPAKGRNAGGVFGARRGALVARGEDAPPFGGLKGTRGGRAEDCGSTLRWEGATAPETLHRFLRSVCLPPTLSAFALDLQASHLGAHQLGRGIYSKLPERFFHALAELRVEAGEGRR